MEASEDIRSQNDRSVQSNNFKDLLEQVKVQDYINQLDKALDEDEMRIMIESDEPLQDNF